MSAAVAAVTLVPLSLAWPAAAWADEPAKEPGPLAQNIDPAVLAEMEAQATLQPAVDLIHEAALADPASGFAGVAYEGDGLTVYYKGALDSKMSSVVTGSRGIGKIKVAAAKHSRAELQRESDRISARGLEEGSDIQAVSMPVNGSGLTVERLPVTETQERSKKRVAKGLKPLKNAQDVIELTSVTVPVKITTASEVIKATADRYNDVAPWNGGARWESWRNGARRAFCSTGFGVKNNAGERFVLTAGHCATPPDYARQGLGSNLEYMGPVYQQSVSADLAIIRANGSSLIFEGGPISSVTRTITGWAYWAANQLVCQSGITSAEATSGPVCGLRQRESANITLGCCDSDGDSGYTVSGVIKTVKDGGGTAVRPGDSGGPVYTISGSTGTAKGITSAGSGSTMYFQDWADVGRIWGLSPY